MAYTTADLEALKLTIKSGDLLVDYGDRKIRYRNLNELLTIKKLIEDELAAVAGNLAPTIKTVVNIPIRNL